MIPFFSFHDVVSFLLLVPSSVPQLLSLSLPVHMSVSPAAWSFLPVSPAELGPLFSNSSPFSFSQSLFMLPPPGAGPRPSITASFGPYSVTQVRREGQVRPAAPFAAILIGYLVLSTAHIGAFCCSSVCVPPVRAHRARQGRRWPGEVQGEGCVPSAGPDQHPGDSYHLACFQRNRGAQGLLHHPSKDQILPGCHSFHPNLSVRPCVSCASCLWGSVW